MEAASEAYYKYGVSAEGLRWVVDHCGVAPEDTTSDVCHRILKPATVGEGWENIPVLTNAELRYYDHEYRSLATGTVLHCGFQQSDIPPPGSRPYCEVRQSHRCRFVWRRFGRHVFPSDCCVVAARGHDFTQVLLQDPNTVAFVGSPNIFVSHAWSYKFVDVVQVLCEFADRQPEPVFFWFDCLCIDEHATQVLGPDFWDTTFKASIASIGHTVVVLSLWRIRSPGRGASGSSFARLTLGLHVCVSLTPKQKPSRRP